MRGDEQRGAEYGQNALRLSRHQIASHVNEEQRRDEEGDNAALLMDSDAPAHTCGGQGDRHSEKNSFGTFIC